MKNIAAIDSKNVPLSEQTTKLKSRRPRRSGIPTLQFSSLAATPDARVATVNFDKRYSSTNPRLTITPEGFIFEGQFYPIKAYLPSEALQFLRNKK